MNTKNLLILLFLSIFTACDLDIVPDVAGAIQVGFTLSPESGQNCNFPCTVTIDNISTVNDNLDFKWDFGDGETFNKREPDTHLYTEPGNYTITLTVCLADGSTFETVTHTVNVVDPVADPIAGFEIINGGCFAPCTVTFENTSTNGMSFIWNFKDGTGDEVETSTNNKEHTFAKAGIYEVMLIAVNGEKRDTLVKPVVVNIRQFDDFETTNGAGKAIHQNSDGSYTVIGNSGLSNGNIYLLQTVPGGGKEIEEVFTFPGFGAIKVEDAIFFTNGTVGVVGIARELSTDRDRLVYALIDRSSTPVINPKILSESAAVFSDRNVIIKRVIAIGSNQLAAVGYAYDLNTDASSAYVKIFDRSLTTETPGVLIDDPTGSDVYVNDAIYKNEQLVLATITIDGSSLTGKLFVTNEFGALQAGFPHVIDNNYSSISGIVSPANGSIYCTVTKQNGKTYLIELSNNNDTGANWEQLVFNSTLNQTQALVWDNNRSAILIIGHQDNDAVLSLFSSNGSAIISPKTYSRSAFNNFYNGIPTIDCGFIFCGATGDDSTLYMVKTGEEG